MIKSGTTTRIVVKLNLTKEVDDVIFTLKSRSNKVQKTLSNENEGIFLVDLTQEETELLVGSVQMEAQINYSDLSVAKTQIDSLYINDTLATKLIDNNAPTEADVDVILEQIKGDVALIITPESSAELIEAVTELFQATKAEADTVYEAYRNGELDGPQGPQGPQGPRGYQGEKGDKGDKGDTGATGPKGATGPQGEKGSKGDTGAQGPKGDKGDKGEQGLQGPKGDTGATGAQGPQGIQGETGPQGPQGEPGQDADMTKLSRLWFYNGSTPPTTLGTFSGLKEGDVCYCYASVYSAFLGLYVCSAITPSYGVSWRPLSTKSATSEQCREGSTTEREITPNNQHQSVFYGLAKAAGNTTQASSINPVGTYTDDAKEAIQTMLGILSVEEVEF